jgi:hypothetical protein
MQHRLFLNAFERALVDDVDGRQTSALLARLDLIEASGLWIQQAPDRPLRDRALRAAGDAARSLWSAAHRQDWADVWPVAPVPFVALNTLADIGLSALSIDDVDSFYTVRAFVRERLPSPFNYDVSQAMVLFGCGQVGTARSLLEAVLAQDESHPAALCGLAFVNQCSGHPGWREGYSKVLATSLDPALRTTVLNLLRDAPLLDRAAALH